MFGAIAGHEPQILATLPVGGAKIFAVGNKLVCFGYFRYEERNNFSNKVFVLDFWNQESGGVRRGEKGVQVTSICIGRSDIEGEEYKLRPLD